MSEVEHGSYITIGTFDGVHKGHQQLISTVIKEGKKENFPAIVITFDPLPKVFFDNAEPQFVRLTSSCTRAERVALLGADILIEYTFDQSFSKISADDFISKILMNLNPQKIFIGKDFKFGYKGLGDFAFLKQAGTKFGFETERLEFINLDSERISSTRVRNAVRHGDIELVTKLMGKQHEVSGRIIRMMNGIKVFLMPDRDIILPPAGEYKVSIGSHNNKYFTKARILDTNKFIEVTLEEGMNHHFFKENVILQFLEPVTAIKKEKTRLKEHKGLRSILN
ncbi:FAD synthetase family protein [Aneurinibacillus tyrosinisolvens]|uniref:FAD synthetase family protein n=1 Tax=Aneurinibacillus tyrosinisolvens TaxID=1443435 RepID=UPI00063F9A24|nr:FAD synthetase family protein [Aneurinibacillus tyrosinisolvens]